MATAIAGENSDPLRLRHARTIAEAQLDLQRIRRARSLLLTNPIERAEDKHPDTTSRLIAAVSREFGITNRKYFVRLEEARTNTAAESKLRRDLDDAHQELIRRMAALEAERLL